MDDKKVVSLESYRTARKKKKTYAYSCIHAARNCLMYARYFSKWLKDNPMLLMQVESYIQALVRCTIKAGVTLGDIGTSQEELYELLSPPELCLSDEAKMRRWRKIDIPPYL